MLSHEEVEKKTCRKAYSISASSKSITASCKAYNYSQARECGKISDCSWSRRTIQSFGLANKSVPHFFHKSPRFLQQNRKNRKINLRNSSFQLSFASFLVLLLPTDVDESSFYFSIWAAQILFFNRHFASQWDTFHVRLRRREENRKMQTNSSPFTAFHRLSATPKTYVSISF